MLFLRAPFFVPETGYALLSPSLRRSMTLSWMAHLMCGFCWMAHLLCGFCSMIVRFFACLSCAFGSANDIVGEVVRHPRPRPVHAHCTTAFTRSDDIHDDFANNISECDVLHLSPHPTDSRPRSASTGTGTAPLRYDRAWSPGYPPLRALPRSIRLQPPSRRATCPASSPPSRAPRSFRSARSPPGPQRQLSHPPSLVAITRA